MKSQGFQTPNSVRFCISGLEAELDFAQNMKVVGFDVFEVPVKFQVIWSSVERDMSILLLLFWVDQNAKTALVIGHFDWNLFGFCCWCLLMKCSWMSQLSYAFGITAFGLVQTEMDSLQCCAICEPAISVLVW